LFASVVTLVILALCGYAVGVRPGVRVPPARPSVWLITFSVILFLATWALASDGWIPRLKAWGIDDLDMIGLHVVFALISVAGSVLLLPAWGYVIGRAVRTPRRPPAGKLQLTGASDGWQD
jgi:hypothetical protein